MWRETWAADLDIADPDPVVVPDAPVALALLLGYAVPFDAPSSRWHSRIERRHGTCCCGFVPGGTPCPRRRVPWSTSDDPRRDRRRAREVRAMDVVFLLLLAALIAVAAVVLALVVRRRRRSGGVVAVGRRSRR